MQKIILIIKGFIIGCANVIPGVSGGTIMMSLGVFEEIISSVNHFLEDKKKNLIFLLCVVIGAVLSIIIMSRVITSALENYNVQTILFFIGLIIGGFPLLFKNIKGKGFNYKYLVAVALSFTLAVGINILSPSVSGLSLIDLSFVGYLKLFLVGVIAASSMIVPGLSGSFMLILFGYYEPIMNLIEEFTSFSSMGSNFFTLLVFGTGIICGLAFMLKLIEYLLKKHTTITYYAIIGFVLSSVICIITSNFLSNMNLSFGLVLSSGLLFILGAFITYRLGE